MSTEVKQHSNKSAQLVIDLRQRFLEDYQNNKDAYNEEDVQRIRTNDWYVKRFLLARRRNLDEAFEMLKNTMRWRQEFGLPTMKDRDFPIEFYKVGGIFPYEKDINGNVVVYLRIRMHRKIPEMADPIKKFLMHIVNKTDKEVDGNGMVIVFDCSGAGYSNMDLDFLTFLITSGNSYFPVGLKYILVYELSWFLNAFRRIAMSLIPQSFLPLIKFANKDDVTNYIPLENLPDFMGGYCQRNYRYIPDGCTTVAKLAVENGYTQEDVDRILPIFEPLLEEADKAIAENKFSDANNDRKTIETNEKNGSEIETIKSVVPIKTTNQYILSSKPLSNILGIFPNDVLYLEFEAQLNTYQSNLLLQNLSDRPIAYKVQSNNPNSYTVSPRLGIIMVGASLRCNFQLIDGQKHRKNDKFMVIAVPVDDHKMDANRFGKLWTENGKQIYSHKLLTKISEKTVNLSDDKPNGAQDMSEELICLKQWCNQLERRQRRLCLLLNVMLVVICALLALVIYSHSFSELSILKPEIIRNFRPKNIFNSEFK